MIWVFFRNRNHTNTGTDQQSAFFVNPPTEGLNILFIEQILILEKKHLGGESRREA